MYSHCFFYIGCNFRARIRLRARLIVDAFEKHYLHAFSRQLYAAKARESSLAIGWRLLETYPFPYTLFKIITNAFIKYSAKTGTAGRLNPSPRAQTVCDCDPAKRTAVEVDFSYNMCPNNNRRFRYIRRFTVSLSPLMPP